MGQHAVVGIRRFVKIRVVLMFTSDPNDFAIFLRTSGATLGTLSQYSPNNHSILALAIGTWEEIQDLNTQ